MLNIEQLHRDTLAADTKSAELLWSLCFGTLQNRVDRNIPNEAIVTTEPLTVGKNSFRFIISDPIEVLTTLYYLCLEVWIFFIILSMLDEFFVEFPTNAKTIYAN